MNIRAGIMVVIALAAGSVQGQSIVNWGAGVSAPATPASVATPSDEGESPTSIPLPPPLPPAAPSMDMGSMAGYVQQDVPEPTTRLDRNVSPELAARYAQMPGESEDAYIARMNALYRETQADLEATKARNADYIRSLGAPILGRRRQ